MKYKVTFKQKVTQNENNTTIVEAASEKEARAKVLNYEYDEILSCDAEVISIEDTEIINVEETDEE